MENQVISSDSKFVGPSYARKKEDIAYEQVCITPEIFSVILLHRNIIYCLSQFCE